MNEDTQVLLTYQDAAERLGCALNSLYNKPGLREKLGFRYVPDIGMRTTPENLQAFKRSQFKGR